MAMAAAIMVMMVMLMAALLMTVIVVMVLMIALLMIVIVVMVLMIALLVIMVMVMMLMTAAVLFLMLFFHMGQIDPDAFHGVQDLLSAQLFHRRSDHRGVRIQFPDQLQRLLDLLLRRLRVSVRLRITVLAASPPDF